MCLLLKVCVKGGIMQIDKTSSVSFSGKVFYNSNLPSSVNYYLKRVMAYPINGHSAQDILAKKSYDLHFFPVSTIESKNPCIGFYSRFKTRKQGLHTEAHHTRIEKPVDESAERIHKFLETIDKTKSELEGYNNIFEWFSIIFKKFSKK